MDLFWQTYPTVTFGSPATEERLAALIIAGRKRATVWDGRAKNETMPGMRWTVIALGLPVAVIETTKVEQRKFTDIDDAFAFEEGEGDRSLAFWRAVHEEHFRKQCCYSVDMLLWCEHFKLVAVLSAGLAERATEHVRAEEEEAAVVLRGLGMMSWLRCREQSELN